MPWGFDDGGQCPPPEICCIDNGSLCDTLVAASLRLGAYMLLWRDSNWARSGGRRELILQGCTGNPWGLVQVVRSVSLQVETWWTPRLPWGYNGCLGFLNSPVSPDALVGMGMVRCQWWINLMCRSTSYYIADCWGGWAKAKALTFVYQRQH